MYQCYCGLSAVYSRHTTWSWPTEGPILIQLPRFHQDGRRATWKLHDVHGVRGLLIHRGQTVFVGHYRYAHVEGCRITVLDDKKYCSRNVVSEYLSDGAYIFCVNREFLSSVESSECLVQVEPQQKLQRPYSGDTRVCHPFAMNLCTFRFR